MNTKPDPFFYTDRELIDALKSYPDDSYRYVNELVDRTGIDPDKYYDETVNAFDDEAFFSDAERLLGLSPEEEGGVDNGCEIDEDVQ